MSYMSNLHAEITDLLCNTKWSVVQIANHLRCPTDFVVAVVQQRCDTLLGEPS